MNETQNDSMTLDQKFKIKQDKLGYDYIPPECEQAIMECFHEGAQKYAKDSWKKFPNFKSHYYSAMRRHLNEWKRGRKRDKDSKQMHMAHVATTAIMMLWYDFKEEEYFEPKSAEAILNLMKKILYKNENWDMVEEEVKRWFT